MIMRLLKFLFVAGALFALAVVGNVFVGDLSKQPVPISETVILDVD